MKYWNFVNVLLCFVILCFFLFCENEVFCTIQGPLLSDESIGVLQLLTGILGIVTVCLIAFFANNLTNKISKENKKWTIYNLRLNESYRLRDDYTYQANQYQEQINELRIDEIDKNNEPDERSYVMTERLKLGKLKEKSLKSRNSVNKNITRLIKDNGLWDINEVDIDRVMESLHN